MAETNNAQSVEVQLAIISTQLSTALQVYPLHTQQISKLQLDVNTHKVEIAELKARSLGLFSKVMLIIGGIVGAGGLITNWIK